MQVGESVAPPVSGQHDATCPFCAGGTPALRGLTTHAGAENSSTTLTSNLGNIPTYTLEKDLIEEFPVNVAPAAHHLLPGNQAMDPHSIEMLTTVKKNSNLLEDIGYDINAEENGVWLPTYPDLYKNKSIEINGKSYKGYDVSKYMWAADNIPVSSGGASVLPEATKIKVVNLIQARWGQAHIGDHKATKYDQACRDRLTLLKNLMVNFWIPKCNQSQDQNGKLRPPYGLVQRINLQSTFMNQSIMPRRSPREWQQWVSMYAKEFTELAKKGFRGKVQ